MTILDILRAPGDEEPIVLTGNQIYEFEDGIKQLPPSRVDHRYVLDATRDAARIIGYPTFALSGRARLNRKSYPSRDAKYVGHFAGSEWWAEK